MVGTDDGIDGAHVAAIRATNAKRLVDNRKRCCFCCGVGELERVTSEEIRESLDSLLATWWAKIDCGVVLNDCQGIRAATGITALRTLRLWQQLIDLLYQGFTIHWQPA